MSEPRSLFLRVSINKERYLEFLRARPAQAEVDSNWEEWWSNRDKYGDAPVSKLFYAYEDTTNQSVIDGWLSNENAIAFSNFDEATQTWEFGAIQAVANWDAIVPIIAFCEGISAFKNNQDGDFMIIYPYFWGDDDVMAYMTFEGQQGVLWPKTKRVNEVPEAHIDYAASRLAQRWQQYEATREED